MYGPFLFLLFFIAFGCAGPGSVSGNKSSSGGGPENEGALTTQNMEELVSGWKEMIETIENNNPDEKSLDQKTFKLTVRLQGDWELKILPEKAFAVAKDDHGIFMVTIKNGRLLYENTSGIVKRTFIQSALSKVGGDKGKISLTPRLECLFSVSFHQRNGAFVDFDKLGGGYRYEYGISHPQLVTFHSQQKSSALFKRHGQSPENVTVNLKMVDRKSDETYLSPEVSIPACDNLDSSSPSGPQEVLPFPVPRTPGQCLVHLQGGKEVHDSKTPLLEATEIFGNNCGKKIKCLLPVRYGLVKNKKFIFVKKKSFEFSLPAQSWTEVPAGFDFTPHIGPKGFDSKFYVPATLDRSALPHNFPGFSGSENKDFLQCSWDK